MRRRLARCFFRPAATPNGYRYGSGRGTAGRARFIPAPPFRHSREIPAYAGMTGNPVPRGNDGGDLDMGTQASRLHMTKRCHIQENDAKLP